MLATLVVDTFSDDPASGFTLREAISESNSNGSSTQDEIILSAGTYTLTRSGDDFTNANGDLDIIGDLIIRGAGPGQTTIDAGGNSGIGERVFHTRNSIDVLIQDLTIRGGRRTGGGGGLFATTASRVTLDNVIMTDNTATLGGGAIQVNNNATVTVIGSTITDNTSNSGGGGIANFSTLIVDSSTISLNTGDAGGGGIYTQDAGSITRIVSSTISENTSGNNGGGVTNFNAIVSITNSTISGNTTSGLAGGVANFSDGNGNVGQTTLLQSTIHGNSQSSGGAVHTGSQNGATSAPVNFGNTIFAANTGANGNLSQFGTGAALNNLGNSLNITSGAAAVISGTLADNGGPTLTHALVLGGPAINAGSPNFAKNPGANGTFDSSDEALTADQRGGMFRRNDGGGVDVGAFEFIQFVDFGDAPDASNGSAVGDYRTRETDGGPSHLVVGGLFLGNSVDGFESGTGQNADATADDLVASGGVDDEDGVLSPIDLQGTEGAAPTISLLATNATGSTATLYGWIDYDKDGVFDNVTEHVSVSVPNGTSDGRFTLTFPSIPVGSSGKTYARFRLSTDTASANSTGPATDGEVEDYVFDITAPSSGTVDHFLKIATDTGGGPTLANSDRFGGSIASVGDLDGDGVADLVVGALGVDTGGSLRGAVHVLFLNANGTVKSSTKIADNINGGPSLSDFDQFGTSLASVGDLDGDGVADLAVGAVGDDGFRGAVYVLFLNANGTVKSSTKIASDTGGGPTLADSDFFGRSMTNIGDLDGDGVADLAVGAVGDETGGLDRGAVHVLFLNANGTVKSRTKIASDTSGGPTLTDNDFFGSSLASVGDLDGDGVADLVVGAQSDDTGGSSRGAVHVLFLHADGTAKSSIKIAGNTNGGPVPVDRDQFGSSLTSLGDLNGDGVVEFAVGATGDDTGGSSRGAVHVLFLSPPSDYGDAPDTGVGTGAENYQTTAADGGPSHRIVSGLHLGHSVIGDFGNAQNNLANADDVHGGDLTVHGGADDEDGVLNVLDLQGTEGAAATVTLLATNTSGTAATLYGWIDYDGDGDFDNATERASINVPSGTTDGRFTLTFPSIPTGSSGKTYTRFRLSTDAAAANSTGPANDGEVEDYVFTITTPTSGTVNRSLKIADQLNGGPALSNLDRFGFSVAPIGDFDGDGVNDVVVGAQLDDTGGENRGAVYLQLLNTDGSVKSSTKIASGTNGGPSLSANDFFGSSVASIGDINGDGIIDLAVGAFGDDSASDESGAVYVLLMKADGSVERSTKIDGRIPGLIVSSNASFGRSVTGMGDIDGDGVNDIAVGARRDNYGGGTNQGAVHVLFLNSDGTVKRSTAFGDESAVGLSISNADFFGHSVASVGDLNGDGINDLAVGANGDDTGGNRRGAVYVLLMNANGFPSSATKIANNTGGGPTLADTDYFGHSVAGVGDLDGDGVNDLIVGAPQDDTEGTDRGAVHVLLLASDGSVKSSSKIAGNTSGGALIGDSSLFGGSVSSLGDLDGDGVVDLAVGAYRDDNGGSVHVLFLDPLSNVDFGDAPDSAMGTGPANYRTTAADNGPSHRIVNGIRLGATVDGDDGALQNLTANADDVGGTGADDEDGVLSPLDLQGTEGAAPTVTLLTTNTSGTAATLYGWIDYDGDGDFDNATERASISVPGGTTDGRFTLTFPSIPTGSSGKTYARFRLSTDAAAANSTGPATDGEVEDYVFDITAPSSGTVDHFLKIASETGGGPTLAIVDFFGSAVTNLGDLDGDGVADLAVGAQGDNTGGFSRGAVHVLLMDAEGTVKSSTKIASDTNGGPTLMNFDRFGSSLTSVGDLDGDGVADLAVGAVGDDTGGDRRGAVHVLFLNADGTVKSSTKIATDTNGGPTLADLDVFGVALASLGDLDGDGVADLAVGADSDDTGGTYRGAVHVLFLNADGTVKSRTKIASDTGGGPTLANRDLFGNSLTSVGDLDGDGVADLAVGAIGDDTGGESRGAVHVLSLNADGTVKSRTKIASDTGGGPTLADYDNFGRSMTNIGDLDGDGVADLAVGAFGDDTGGLNRGAVHVLFLNATGTVESRTKIASDTGGGPTLASYDYFGSSLASVGDLDGDGVADLAVGATGDDAYGSYSGASGAVHVLFLSPPDRTPPTVDVSLDDSSLTSGETATVTISFSENVVGFAAEDVTAPNGTLSDLTVTFNPRVFTATFTPSPNVEDATNVITVDGSYTDVAGNVGVSGSSSNFIVDLLPPALTVPANLSVQANVPSGAESSLAAIVNFLAGASATDGVDANPSVTASSVPSVLPIGTTTVTFTAIDDSGNQSTTTATVTVTAAQPLDFGDAPSNYPVTLTQDGARHGVGSLVLGSSIDAETNGVPTDDATGDGSDEDGVTFLATAIASPDSATISSIAVVSSAAAKLDAWIDFNGDGNWDQSEQIFTSLDLVAGANTLIYTIPSGAAAGDTAARFRLSTAGGLAPTGAATDGEVEDYIVPLQAAGNNTVIVTSINPGTKTIETSGSDVVVREGDLILFQTPAADLAVLDFTGSDGDDTIEFNSLIGSFPGGVGIHGGTGTDTLRVTGADDVLAVQDNVVTGLELIDLSAPGTQRLILSQSDVAGLPDTGATLRISIDTEDTLELTDGDFQLNESMVDDDQFIVQAQSNAGLGQTFVQIAGVRWTNPLDRFDVNADRSVTEVDALRIINALNSGELFQPGSDAVLIDPKDLTIPFVLNFVDTTADGNLTALDALRVINFLNERDAGGEPLSELFDPSLFPAPPSADSDPLSHRRKSSWFERDPIERLSGTQNKLVSVQADARVRNEAMMPTGEPDTLGWQKDSGSKETSETDRLNALDEAFALFT